MQCRRVTLIFAGIASTMAMHLDHVSISSPNLYYGVLSDYGERVAGAATRSRIAHENPTFDEIDDVP